MATYQIECEKCGIYWEVERPMSNPPHKGKCPQCKKMGKRVYTAPALKFCGMDFYVNQARAEKFARDGMDKDTANQFLNDAISESQKRVKEGGQNYKKMYLDPDFATKNGIAKKVDDKEKIRKREVAQKIRQDLYPKVEPKK